MIALVFRSLHIQKNLSSPPPGQTVFHYAASSGIYAFDCITLLETLDNEGLMERDIYGNTVLHTAVAVGAGKELVAYLLTKLDVNSQNGDGDTVLHLCLSSSLSNPEIEQLLTSNGADSTIRNIWGEQAWTAAAYKGLRVKRRNSFPAIVALGDGSELEDVTSPPDVSGEQHPLLVKLRAQFFDNVQLVGEEALSVMSPCSHE